MQVELDEDLNDDVQTISVTNDPEQRSFELGPGLVKTLDVGLVYLAEI